MRRILIALTLLGCPLPLLAGVYNTEERLNPLISSAGGSPLDMAEFKALRDDRRGPYAGKEGNELKKLYTRKAAELQGRAFSGTIEDKINLSAYLIGLGKHQEAARLLEPEARGAARDNFMLLANLATAYFNVGQLDRAADYQRQVLDNWPHQARGFTPEQLQWLRGVETKLWILYMLRRKEADERATQVTQPDDLFKVHFVGKDGKYTPGKLPDEQKLPGDALATTQQLILWLPFENRLHWLLGEILNAQGQQADALSIFDELIWGAYSPPELKAHRSAIQASLPIVVPPPFFTLTPRSIAILAAAGLVIVLFIYLQLRELFRRPRQLVGS
jgi:tetratricopeptide (TPR) repeat protein